MKVKVTLVMMVVAILLMSGVAMSDLMVVAPTDDTEIRSGSPDVNYDGVMLAVGEHTAAWVGMRRSLVKFDLAAVPGGQIITSVKLYLRLMINDYPEPDSIDVYEATDAGVWSEATATWNTHAGWNLALAETDVVNFGATYVYYSWNITSSLSPADVVTFVLRAKDEDCDSNDLAKFWDVENGGTTSAPYLEVTYVPVPEPATMAILALGGLAMGLRRMRLRRS